MTQGNEIADRVDNLLQLIRKQLFDPKLQTQGLLRKPEREYLQVLSVDRLGLARLVEAELNLATREMATAFEEAKQMVGKMDTFLKDNTHKVKNFLEEQKLSLQVSPNKHQRVQSLSLRFESESLGKSEDRGSRLAAFLKDS